MKLFSIVGSCFREGELPTMAHLPENEGGIAMVMPELAGPRIFSGYFQFDDKLEYGQGQMIATNGPSTLSVNHFTDEQIEFHHSYQSGTWIRHNLTRLDNGSWIGEYRGPQVGSGNSRVLITELKKEIFRISPQHGFG